MELFKPASGPSMDEDLLRIARRVFEDSQSHHHDYLAATEAAVCKIRSARPDVTASEALSALNIARRT